MGQGFKERVRFDIKASTEEPGIFEGFLSTYGNVDHGRDVMVAGCFKNSIAQNGDTVPCLWSHDQKTPIGLLTLIDEPQGLKVRGKLSLGVASAADAYTLLKDNVVKGMSIGFTVRDREFKDGIRYIKDAELFEGSLVVFPMNDMAQVTGVKSMQDGMGDFDQELAEMQAATYASQAMNCLYDCLMSAWWIASYDGAGTASKQYISEVLSQFQASFLAGWDAYMTTLGMKGKDAAELVKKAQAISLGARVPGLSVDIKVGKRISADTSEVVRKAREHAAGAVENLKSALEVIDGLLTPPAEDEPVDEGKANADFWKELEIPVNAIEELKALVASE